MNKYRVQIDCIDEAEADDIAEHLREEMHEGKLVHICVDIFVIPLENNDEQETDALPSPHQSP